MRPTAAALALLAALSGPAAAQESADTLRVSWRDAVPVVDPYYNSQRNGIILGDLAWDTLLHRAPATGALGPGLATAWRQVDDLTYEFTLRQGVTFHNGDPFSAEDVAYTVNGLLADKRVATPGLFAFLDSAEAIDATQVRLRLKRVYPPALNVISAIMPIRPAAHHARVGVDAYIKAPVGTGPYRFAPIASQDTLQLSRFEGYYAGSPKGRPDIGRIVIRQVADVTSEMTELLGGRADWISDFPADQFDNFARMPQLRAVRAGVQRLTYVNMDAAGRSGADNPMTRLKVRQAVAHAIDRRAIATQFMAPESQVPDAPCFAVEFGCDQSAAVRYPYDPARARALLAEAGYPNGVEVVLTTYLPNSWVGAIQANLNAAGFTARVQTMTAGAAIQQAQQGKLQMAFAAWGGFAVNDVSALLNYFYTKGSFAMAHDDDLTALVNRAGAINDAAERRALYAQALHRISDQAYMIPVFTYVKTYAFSRQLDFTPYADDNPRFYRARWQ
jgi:peptide/nickel transport system substrate-binding protein